MSDGREYWKSLEELAGDPKAIAFLEREFPEGASEPPAGVPRRTMLMLLGASLSMAGMAGCRRPVEHIVPYVNGPEEIIPGVPLHYATTMPMGNSAYGLVVESHEGRPTKIEGNGLHPSSLGSSSFWNQAAMLSLYDPDRSKSVRQSDVDKTWADWVGTWTQVEQTYLQNEGAGLAVLTEPFSSPTLARLAEAFRRRFPRAGWYVNDPISDENIYEGIERAAGATFQPVHHFDRANVILALDSDFLLTESEAVRNARGFADGRRVTQPSDSMNRLYVVESVMSVTGGNADHRLRLDSGRIGAFLATVASELQTSGLDVPASASSDGDIDRRWAAAVARDLLANRSRGLIVAGRRQPPEVHAAVLALNSALGNLGETVTLHDAKDTAISRNTDLRHLVGEMGEGAVDTLVLLGGNPAYAVGADIDFAGALEGVPRVVHLSNDLNETSRLAEWHLPRAHFLEAWGDARAVDGTLSVIQPLIEPLYGAKSDVEVLGLLATGEERSGHDLTRQTWQVRLGADGFEKRWNRVLHDGLLADSGSASVQPRVDVGVVAGLARLDSGAASVEDLEIVFQACPAVFDGRHANNGWLQELPDPVSKLTWDNAALVSPATARALDLNNQDVARLTHGGRQLEMPVWIVPGQADNSVAVSLGYGRTAAGRIGDGVGFDAYRLRDSAALHFARGLRIEKTGETYALATTQDHTTYDTLGIEEQKRRVPTVIRETTLEEYRHHPHFAKEMVEHPPLESLWKEHSYKDGYQWGMSIDLTVCTGCNACVIACQSENNIPIVGKQQVSKGREMHWLRVDRYYKGSPEQPEAVFQPVPCMQCENAPCEQVCPVAATVHDAEGLNTMVYNRCIGTRYCSNNCPYKVRRFNYYSFTKDTPEVQRMANNPDVTVRSRGVMEKCTYCTQRIAAAKIDAKLKGQDLNDGDVQPACQQACPTQAISFGNINDPDSRVSRLKSQDRDYALLAELNNKPRTTFLAKLRNPNPELEA